MTIKSKKRLVSIVIKNEHIKISEVSKDSKTIKVHKAVTIPTPQNAVFDGVLEDKAELAKVIKSALDMNEIKTKDVIFSIVSGKIATKEVIIPSVSENKIEDIVKMNATEYFPVNIDEYIIKHTILERINENNQKKIKLQVVAAPELLIAHYNNLAELLELRIETIDYVGNSAYQILKREISEDFSLVINIENEGTVVNIFEKNILKMQRNVPYGKSVVVNAVMDEFKIKSEKEALLKLQTENLLHEEFDDDEITESLNYIVGSINRIIDYYISRNENKNFKSSYIVGNATSIIGLVPLLSNELKLDLITIDEFKSVTFEENSNVPSNKFTSYITNVGALLDPLNIISSMRTENKKKRIDVRKFIFILGGAAIVSSLIVAIPFFRMLDTKSEVESLKENIDKIKDVEDIVNEYYTAKDMALDAMQFAKISFDNNDYLHIFVEQLEEKIPKDVAFTSMGVTSGVVTISGTATTKSSLAKLIQQLQTIDSVANVYISNESESEDNTGVITVTFSLTCTFSTITVEEGQGDK